MSKKEKISEFFFKAIITIILVGVIIFLICFGLKDEASLQLRIIMSCVVVGVIAFILLLECISKKKKILSKVLDYFIEFIIPVGGMLFCIYYDLKMQNSLNWGSIIPCVLACITTFILCSVQKIKLKYILAIGLLLIGGLMITYGLSNGIDTVPSIRTYYIIVTFSALFGFDIERYLIKRKKERENHEA